MIHPAVGEQWRIKIPIPLSTIEGNPETSQDNAWWEHLLLKVQAGSQSCCCSQPNWVGLSGKGGFPHASGK
ncbi:hypothetical protein Y1Q_0015399 [Alligator mississippiensis]|uniref:Uncharacterized protein n=1 Tax=Alligator mississippiensis TaxID=8496 RepID=A0A151MM21_ALLMI|nr:hypothetical protein Y1Q_0015399 [Alligator mississippiensis]